MLRDYKLTESHPEIHGQFWVPGESEHTIGILRLQAGERPVLELAKFSDPGRSAFFDRILSDQERSERRGHAVMHGTDDNGAPITLLNCFESTFSASAIRLSRTMRCDAAIFGVHLSADDLKFAGVVIRFDHQDEWLQRSAFGKVEHELSTDESKGITMIKIPVRESREIELSLTGYARSRFNLWWTTWPSNTGHRFGSRSYLDLLFETSESWTDLRAEFQSWSWLLGLATRSPIDIEELFVRRSDLPLRDGHIELKLLPCWIARRNGPSVAHSSRTRHDFHFTFDDVEATFVEVHARWRRMREPWAAVLHRFVAVSHPRDLWLNEEFLFLAQAIESMFRARTGKKGQIDFLSAARQAWDESPAALQTLLGPKESFASRLRKSRNYWTHYGHPGPDEDPEIVGNDGLIEFNEQLRWVVEAAILREIGIQNKNVARVWHDRWRLHRITFA